MYFSRCRRWARLYSRRKYNQIVKTDSFLHEWFQYQITCISLNHEDWYIYTLFVYSITFTIGNLIVFMNKSILHRKKIFCPFKEKTIK